MWKRIQIRIRSYLIRKRKAQPSRWLYRYDQALDNLWKRFHRMPHTRTSLKYLERNINRLIRLRPPFGGIPKK